MAELTCNGVDDDCDPATADEPDGDQDGFSLCDDCDDGDPAVSPAAPELTCNGVDDDCDPATEDAPDGDGDGFSLCDDCDDADPAVSPAAGEAICDGIDNDCDPATEDEPDDDGDGYSACEDCDDGDAGIQPGAAEDPCDGLDNDCDPTTPDEPDGDGDGYTLCDECDDGDPALNLDDLDGDGWDTCHGDCDDGDPDLNLDDLDGDGFDTCAGDCDDGDADVYPGALDVCDGLDNDCDGGEEEDALNGMVILSVDSEADAIYEIDPATGATTQVAPLDPSATFGINTMTTHPDGGTIIHDYSTSSLHFLDACAGTVTLLGAHGAGNTCGVSFGPDGRLFGLDSTYDQLVEFDPATGAATTIGPIGFDVSSCGMTYDCSRDALVGATSNGNRVFYIDETTGAAYDILESDVPFSSVGIAYDPVDDVFFCANASQLFELDLATGLVTTIGALGGSNIDDLEFHPECD